MFNVPGAKKYDFSQLNPLIVASVVLLICYLGSRNTYFDQFYKVSKLPENRTELSILQSFSSGISGNKVVFNMSLKYAFKITYENFRKSFKVQIDHYGFKSIYYYNNLFDYQLSSDNYLSGFALSSIFGNVSISYFYLDEIIYEHQANIPGIHLLFPGNTLLSKKSDHFHFSNVYISNKNELKVYFQNTVEYDIDWVSFENGCSLPLSNLGKTAKDDCSGSQDIKCNQHEQTTHLFAAPPDSDLNPYSLFISLFNPISTFSKPEHDKILIWSKYPLSKELSQIILDMKSLFDNQFEVLDTNQKNFFNELRIRTKVSHNFEELSKKVLKTNNIPNNFEENKLLIITDEKTKNIFSKDKANKIASKLCKSANNKCNFDIIEFKCNADIISKINQAQFLILPKEKAHFMFSLCKGARLFVLDDQDDNNVSNIWIQKMAKDLSIEVNIVKYENNNIDSSVFNL